MSVREFAQADSKITNKKILFTNQLVNIKSSRLIDFKALISTLNMKKKKNVMDADDSMPEGSN